MAATGDPERRAGIAFAKSREMRAPGDGLCRTIHIGERVTQLFYEDPRWFVQEALSDELAC